MTADKQTVSSHNSIETAPAGRARQGYPVVLQNVSHVYGSKTHGKWALRDVSFEIEPGIFGLLGRNGAGKTTLLQILATLLEPTSGSIRIGPYDVQRQRWPIRSLLGFLPQEQGFYPTLTVSETLRYMAVLQGLEHIEREVQRVLEMVNLSDRAQSRVKALSGGMRRRLGLAQALLGDPRLIIVDEPTTGLDPVEQQRFRTLLGSLGAHGERTIILSTHIVADVASVASRVAVLELGGLRFQGTTGELTAVASGRCWQWRTSIEQVEAARETQQLLVTSLTPYDDASGLLHQVSARVVGPQPAPEAVVCEPTLEDGYFALVGRSSSDDNGK